MIISLVKIIDLVCAYLRNLKLEDFLTFKIEQFRPERFLQLSRNLLHFSSKFGFGFSLTQRNTHAPASYFAFAASTVRVPYETKAGPSPLAAYAVCWVLVRKTWEA